MLIRDTTGFSTTSSKMEPPLAPPTSSQGSGVFWLAPLTTGIVAALVTLAVLVWINRRNIPKGAKLPPGPRGIPFLGFLPFMTERLQSSQFLEWSKVYGPIISFKIAGKDVVVLNDFNSVKSLLSKREILSRGTNLVLDRVGIVGVANLNGQKWEDNRRFCLHALRDLGFGRKSMEDHIKEESRFLVERFAEAKGAPIPVAVYATPSISNNITSLVFGRRLEFEDPKRKFLDESLAELMRFLSSGSILDFFPAFLSTITAKFSFTREARFRTTIRGLLEFVSTRVSEHKDTLEEASNRDFIDGYLKKIRDHRLEPESSFQSPILVGNVINFFAAGSNSVLITLQWLLLKCAHEKETIQSRIQREIDTHVGRERQPSWKDHNLMPFTMATIWEIYRWRTIAPLSIPREAGDDTFFDGYFIPKGTVVMPNLYAVHMDRNLWENPEVFNPQRFLSQDGLTLLPQPEHLINFSVGKRMCPGQTLATAEIFLYLTTLLQKFDILPEEGKTITMEPRFTVGSFVAPIEQNLRFLERK